MPLKEITIILVQTLPFSLPLLPRRDLSTSSWIPPFRWHWFLIKHHPLSLSFRRLLTSLPLVSFWYQALVTSFFSNPPLFQGIPIHVTSGTFLQFCSHCEAPQLMSLRDWSLPGGGILKSSDLVFKNFHQRPISSHQSYFLLRTPTFFLSFPFWSCRVSKILDFVNCIMILLYVFSSPCCL